MEMLREIRDMKQSIKDANEANISLIRELKDMNLALVRNAPNPSAPPIASSAPVEEEKKQSEPLKEVDLRADITDDQKNELTEKVKELAEKFGSDKS